MDQLVRASVALALIASTLGAIPLTNQKTFGHSVKNGPLPAHTEVTVFEHNCSSAPCVITQIHVPSIYPPHGEQWNWTHGILNFYLDGDTEPTLTMTLLELAGESMFNLAGSVNGDPATDGGPWGIGMMGRTAKSGGVSSTVRIPFGTSIKATIQAPPSSMGQSVYWMIIRGLEGHAVILGDLELPPSARLKIYRVNPVSLENFQLVTLANVTGNKNGALLRVNFDATGPNFGYLEACMRLITDGATTPLFLSSGAEDYFLSASYFDEGMFKTPNSGITFFQRGTVGAYKTHNIDPILFHNGMQLIFRRCEQTSGCGSLMQCPNQFCPPGQSSNSYKYDDVQLQHDLSRRRDELQSSSAWQSISKVDDSTNYSEYFLGTPGATCTATCAAVKLQCNPNMLPWDPVTMMTHLNITDCWKNGTEGKDPVGMKWYAADQPGYIPLAINPATKAKEPNYRECMGFVGFPPVSDCNAQFPTNARVCHCTATVPPPPPGPPTPPADEVIYNTAVWLYEWDANSETHDNSAQSSHHNSAALKVVAELAKSNLISQSDEDDLVDRLLKADVPLVSLINGMAHPDHHQRLARQVKRLLRRN